MDSSDTSAHPFVFANIHLFLPMQHQQKNKKTSELFTSTASTSAHPCCSTSTISTSLIGHGGIICKRHLKRKSKNHKNRGNVKNTKKNLHYLKPGALAQLRDAQKSARLFPNSSPNISHDLCNNVSKKRRIGSAVDDDNEEEDQEDDDTASNIAEDRRPAVIRTDHRVINIDQVGNIPSASSHDMTPGPMVRVFGPLCPQRKKLLAPKASLVNQPSAPSSLSSPIPSSEDYNVTGESLLESIPLELLVRIVCSLRHDQLKPAFHVSRRLRQAVLIARQCHFDYTTPDRERQDTVDVLTPRTNRIHGGASGPSIRIPSPKAPKPAQKLLQARISLAEMKQLAIPLFHGSVDRVRRMKPPNLISHNAFRAATSHRVLFYEEELCKAVAQNSI